MADPGCQVPTNRPIGLRRQDLSENNKLDATEKSTNEA